MEIIKYLVSIVRTRDINRKKKELSPIIAQTCSIERISERGVERGNPRRSQRTP